MSGIVFDALTGTDFPQHFHVIAGTLLDTLGFQQLAAILEELDSFFQFLINSHQSTLHVILGCNIMRSWIDGHVVSQSQDFPRQRVHLLDGLNFVAKEFYADSFVGACREDIDDIAADTEIASLKSQIVSCVLYVHQFAEDFVALFLHAWSERQHLILVVERRTQAVDTGYGSHDDNVTTLRQGSRRRVTQLLDFVVDLGVLFNIGVCGRHIGFRLVVVVVGYKILHCILREELLEFAVKLCSKCLVMGNDQGRFLHLLDDVGHGKCLTGACNTHQGLVLFPSFYAVYKLFYRLGLIAHHFIF